MSNPLFSTYSQGENRVTSSILAVFERVSFSIVEHIIQTLCQETESNLLLFRNQPVGPVSIPDAVIRASFAYFIETKIKRNSVEKSQIEAHLKGLEDGASTLDRQRLLILTPDVNMPSVLNEISDERLAWANFDTLVDIIEALIKSNDDWITSDIPLPTERETVMLRELVRFLMSEELVGKGDQVLVVPARIAYSEYLKFSAYVCQPNRTFQPSSHMAFYKDRVIHRHIPKIIDQIERVFFTEDEIKTRTDLSDILKQRLLNLFTEIQKAQGNNLRREEAKVIFLSEPNSEDTIILDHDILNDLVSSSGRSVAFVQGQRYVPLDKFKKNPLSTSELLN